MPRNARSTALVVARVVAVTFALSACGYLVVTAQKRANPEPVEVPALAEPVTTVEGPAADGVFLQGSKSLVLDPQDAGPTTTQEPVEGELLEMTVLPPVPAASEHDASADANTHYLYSSKSGAISTTLRPALVPGTVPRAPVPNQPGVTADAQRNAEPVFLPSSKVKTLNTQGLVPGTTSTTPPTFMHSSKSLRLEVQKPPAPKPVDPPKNP